MAITAVKLLPNGVISKASILDPLVDDVTSLDARTTKLEAQPRAEIRRAAALAVATGATFVTCPFDDDGSGARDPFGMWAASPNPTRIVIPAAQDGRWYFRAEIQWDFNITGSRSACFSKNGANVNGANAARLGQDGRRASDATETACRPEWEDNFLASDYLELWLNQTSGISLSVASSAYVAPAVRVYARRLGPAL